MACEVTGLDWWHLPKASKTSRSTACSYPFDHIGPGPLASFHGPKLFSTLGPRETEHDSVSRSLKGIPLCQVNQCNWFQSSSSKVAMNYSHHAYTYIYIYIPISPPLCKHPNSIAATANHVTMMHLPTNWREVISPVYVLKK